MVNIYDSANQLAEDMRQTDQFKALETALAAIKADEKSSSLFKQMDEIQAKIMTSQQNGQPLSKEDQDAYTKLSQEVQNDDNIGKLLAAEQGLYQLIDDVQKTFTKPINDLYQDLRK